jgi:hypothetical protein
MYDQCSYWAGSILLMFMLSGVEVQVQKIGLKSREQRYLNFAPLSPTLHPASAAIKDSKIYQLNVPS